MLVQEHVVGETAALRIGAVFLSVDSRRLGREIIGCAFQNIARKKKAQENGP